MNSRQEWTKNVTARIRYGDLGKLALHFQVSRNTLTRWINGDGLTFEIMDELSAQLGTTTLDLLGSPSAPPPNPSQALDILTEFVRMHSV